MFTLDSTELRQRRFEFAVASLRENADLAPDTGVFSYPARSAVPLVPPQATQPADRRRACRGCV
jgi:hypothetical protein